MITKRIDEIDLKFYTPSKEGSVALVVSTFQPNEKSSQLLRVAIDSMLKFKPDYADVWIVDVGSPDSEFKVVPKEYPSVNFIITDTLQEAGKISHGEENF